MKCSKCGRNSVIELRYSGDFLCESCFEKLFEKRVRKTIRKSKLLRPNDRIAVGLSGGKDSTVTLFLLKKLSENFPKSDLFAIAIDEGVRGYREKCLRSAKKACNELDVPLHIFSLKKEFGFSLDSIAKKVETPMCSYCGVLRRRLLNNKSRELKATKLVTGHNLDDEIQVTLMNIIRGDLKRIARMGFEVGVVKSKKFIPRIKPLRECPEREVAVFALMRKLPVDFSECPYAHEAFRTTVRDMLNELEEKHPGSKFQLLRTTDELIPIMEKHYLTKAPIRMCEKCGEPTSGKICKVCEMVEKLI